MNTHIFFFQMNARNMFLWRNMENFLKLSSNTHRIPIVSELVCLLIAVGKCFEMCATEFMRKLRYFVNGYNIYNY